MSKAHSISATRLIQLYSDNSYVREQGEIAFLAHGTHKALD